jgi:hypothetical protein
MHPLGLYLATTGSQRKQGWVAADERRGAYARVDAVPIAEPDRVSRIGRIAAMVRRNVMRMAGA